MSIRTAYFLDIDNLAGTGAATGDQVSEILEAFEESFHPATSDLVFCAATPGTAFYVKQARPGYSVAVGRGPDGSDRRLLDFADIDVITRQFQRVVIGSGDWIFHALVAQLRQGGIQVDLIQGRGGLSKVLRHEVRSNEPLAAGAITTLRLAA